MWNLFAACKAGCSFKGRRLESQKQCGEKEGRCVMTRYFKTDDGRMICSMSSGNRSKKIPGTPSDPEKWIEVEKKEFYALKRRILRGGGVNPFKKVVV